MSTRCDWSSGHSRAPECWRRAKRLAISAAITLFFAGRAQEVPAHWILYAEDFENRDGGYIASGTEAWRWGVPAEGARAAHSGSRVWATNLTGDYGPNEQSVLMSPSIDLSSVPSGTTFQLRWWQRLVTEPDFDLASVELSRDGGGSWERKYGEVSGPVSPEWTLVGVSLDAIWATPTFRFRFRFQSDASASAAGWSLDDVQLVRIAYEITQATFDTGGGVGVSDDGQLSLVASVEPFAVGYGFGPAGKRPYCLPTATRVRWNRRDSPSFPHLRRRGLWPSARSGPANSSTRLPRSRRLKGSGSRPRRTSSDLGQS